MTFSDRWKEYIVLAVALTLCCMIMINSVMLGTSHKRIYTIEVYEIFDVTHKTRLRDNQTFTCVYTYGQGQFYFRGDIEINVNSSYSFTYTENGKRWRDLTLIEYREFVPLVREKECGGCPD
jgi:hypothetical protein